MDWWLCRKIRHYIHNSLKKGIVYIGMDGDKREYKPKRYRLWKLIDVIEIINGSKITTNDNLNPSLTSSDLLSSTTHDLVETHRCNSSSKLLSCPECFWPGLSLSDFKAVLDLVSFLRWKRLEQKSSKLIKQCHLVKWFPNGWKQ